MNRFFRLLVAGVGAAIVLWLVSFGLLLAYFGSAIPAFGIAAALTGVAVPVALIITALVLNRDARELRKAEATRLRNIERRIEAASEVEPKINALATDLAKLEGETKMSGSTPAPVASAASTGEVDIDMLRSMTSIGRHSGLPLSAFLGEPQASHLVKSALQEEQVLDAIPVLREFPAATTALTLSESRALLKQVRQFGYLTESIPIIEAIAERFGKDRDIQTAELYRSELDLYRGEADLQVEFPPYSKLQQNTRVLHIVGKALPETQSGYTLRTQYTVEAQRRLGIEPIVVAQSGASDRSHELTETYVHRDIRYYLLGGPQRSSVPWDAWMRSNIVALAEVVRLTQPEVLHAHSDFMNAILAIEVGRAYGIPVVNETRGFWEETWLSRTATREGWDDVEAIATKLGLPDMYTLRRDREAQARSESDVVITLARVMQGHIADVAKALEMPVGPVELAPNAVSTDDFPVRMPDPDLRERLNYSEETIVVGYVSSIVEYEGIDTLIRSMFELLTAIDSIKTVRAFAATESDFDGIHNLPESRGELELPSEGRAEHPETEFTRMSETGRLVGSAVEASPLDAESRSFASADVLTDESNESEDIDATHDMESSRPAPAHALAELRESLAASSGDFGRGVTGYRSELVGGQPEEHAEGEDEVGPEVAHLASRLDAVHPDAEADALRNMADELIETAQELLDADIRLLIVGDGAERANLERLARQLELSHVTFTGRVPHEEVLDYYGLIDLFVVPRKPADVTRLVTPLKPFEAMSTGRPCIFSDVDALAEIAEDSGAAKTFRAGDHHDLAKKIGGLLARPEELARMSRAGAEWVRNDRTWDINALTYLRVYADLGMQVELPPEARDFQRLRDAGIPTQTILQRLANGPTPEPGNFWFVSEKSYDTAEAITREGWKTRANTVVKFDSDLDWMANVADGDDWSIQLHSWHFMDSLLIEYIDTLSTDLLQWMLDVALDWWESVKELMNDSYVWTSDAFAQRLPRLARLLVLATKSPINEKSILLLGPAIVHMDRALDATNIEFNNSPSYFRAISCLDYALWLSPLPGAEELRRVSYEQVADLANRAEKDDSDFPTDAAEENTFNPRQALSAIFTSTLTDENKIL